MYSNPLGPFLQFRNIARAFLLAIALTLACADIAKADTFSAGEFVTFVQGDWGAGGAAASLLSADYGPVYAGTGDELVVGVIGVSGQYAMAFSSASAALNYLPAIGVPGPLDTNLADPATSPSGTFGGDVVALALNVDFNNAGFLQGTSSVLFGDLLLTNFTGGFSGLNGLTVSQFLAIANTCLGNGSCPYGLPNVAAITDDLNDSFADGTLSTFADTNLALPGSSTAAPEPSSLLLLAPALGGLAFLRRPLTNRAKENAA